MSMIHIVAFLVAAIAAQQGQAVRLSIPDEPGIEKAEIRWQDKTIPYTRAGKEWVTVIGLDLELKPGSYTGEIRSHKERDGRASIRHSQCESGQVSGPAP